LLTKTALLPGLGAPVLRSLKLVPAPEVPAAGGAEVELEGGV